MADIEEGVDVEARTSIKTAATRFTVLLAAVAAAMLALAGPSSATSPLDKIRCSGGGGGGCTLTVSKKAGVNSRTLVASSR